MLPVFRTSFNSLFDDFFGKETVPSMFNHKAWASTPAVNVTEDADNYRIEVAAPGLEKSDFKLEVENRVLTIRASKEQQSKEEEKNYVRQEFSYSSFERSFTLPESVEQDNIMASHKDGVLYVTVPKREEAKEKPARLIEIA